jgi:hypothetical protein
VPDSTNPFEDAKSRAQAVDKAWTKESRRAARGLHGSRAGCLWQAVLVLLALAICGVATAKSMDEATESVLHGAVLSFDTTTSTTRSRVTTTTDETTTTTEETTTTTVAETRTYVYTAEFDTSSPCSVPGNFNAEGTFSGEFRVLGSTVEMYADGQLQFSTPLAADGSFAFAGGNYSMSGQVDGDTVTGSGAEEAVTGCPFNFEGSLVE